MNEFEGLRQRILQIDESILGLWKERNDTARRIGALKRAADLPLQDFNVEKTVHEHADRHARSLGLAPEAVRSLVRLLIESSIALQERERVRTQAAQGRTAIVVGGAGRMGSWFARFLEGQGFRVFIDDPAPDLHNQAPEGLVPDVVLVASPPSTVADVVRSYTARLGRSTLICDIASIKGESAALLRRLAGEGYRVASLHPMFGPGAETLMGRNVLLLDCGNAEAVEAARALFSHTAARTAVLPIEMHDPIMAEVLGLSHAVNLAFNGALIDSPFTFRQLEEAASTTFRKQVEVAREVARENARLYFEIQTLNPENANMLQRLERSVKELRGFVERRDRLGFVDRMHRSQAYYEGVSLRPK